MTATQKAIVQSLLEGGNVAKCYSSGFRLRSKKHEVISKFTAATFFSIKNMLRREKSGLYFINKNAVRQMHGSSWVKKEYKRLKTKTA